MNTTRRIQYLIGILATSVCALLASAAASPAMAETVRLPQYGPSVPSPSVPAQTHTVIIGGMPGWQIALIAVAAALVAATVAVLLDRARLARHAVPTAA
jgi:hypothetical protein